MRCRERHLPSADRDELARLVADARNPVCADRLISTMSMLPPEAIYEVENVVGCFPRAIAHRPSWAWLWRAADRIVEIDSIYAPLLLFNRSGYARAAALKAIKQLPDTSFFLAALLAT
jgi:hypothetical protein